MPTSSYIMYMYPYRSLYGLGYSYRTYSAHDPNELGAPRKALVATAKGRLTGQQQQSVSTVSSATFFSPAEICSYCPSCCSPPPPSLRAAQWSRCQAAGASSAPSKERSRRFADSATQSHRWGSYGSRPRRRPRRSRAAKFDAGHFGAPCIQAQIERTAFPGRRRPWRRIASSLMSGARPARST